MSYTTWCVNDGNAQMSTTETEIVALSIADSIIFAIFADTKEKNQN